MSTERVVAERPEHIQQRLNDLHLAQNEIEEITVRLAAIANRIATSKVSSRSLVADIESETVRNFALASFGSSKEFTIARIASQLAEAIVELVREQRSLESGDTCFD